MDRYDGLGAEATAGIHEIPGTVRQLSADVSRLLSRTETLLVDSDVELKSTTRQLRNAADSVGTAGRRFRDPRAAIFGPADANLGPGEGGDESARRAGGGLSCRRLRFLRLAGGASLLRAGRRVVMRAPQARSGWTRRCWWRRPRLRASMPTPKLHTAGAKAFARTTSSAAGRNRLNWQSTQLILRLEQR